MLNKIRVKKSQLDYFRAMARKSPLEIQAYLVGETSSPHLTKVDYFAYTTDYGVQTPYQVAWYRNEYEHLKKKAELQGKKIIGSIHSHLFMEDAVLSRSDYESCISEDHLLCGIVSTDGTRTKVRFWSISSPLPVEIDYEKKEAASSHAKRTSSR